jgi:hypothetical protein
MSRAHLGVALVAALGSAAAFGGGSALQHEQTGEVAQRRALDPRLITSLLSRPLWLLGIAADVVGVVLQATALRYGPVVLVQPMLIAALPIGVVLSAALRRSRVRAREARGLLLCSLGLVLLTPVSATDDLGHPGGARAWVWAGAVLTLVVGGLLVLARLRARLAPLAVGVAAGATAGTSAVLLAICAGSFQSLGRLLTTPAPYALVIVGATAMLLTQGSFQTGTLAAPLAALTVTEPIVAVVLALGVLHQHLSAAPAARAAGVAGALAAVSGVLLLARAGEP